MRSFSCLFALALFACGGASGAESTLPAAAEAAQLSNRDKAVALLESIESGDPAPAAYVSPNEYTQHNLAVADGLEGFGEVMQNAPPGGFQVQVVRAFEDGDYVFTHSVYDFFGPKIGFDVFRFEDGLIVEHWDNLIEVMPPNPSGRSQTDGPTEATDLDATEANRTIVRDFYESVLVGGDMARITDFIAPDAYAQHNPNIGDGLAALGEAVQAMAEAGTPMTFTRVHQVLAEGSFVLVMAEGALGEQPMAYYDLFRVADGKIVEHWDVMAPIPPRSEWRNDNGKF
ncbi:MAG: nuclear transport factor 2 family protein [Myxococcota bacterium]